MSRAWYMDSSDADQREEHQLEPPQFIPVDKLREKTGVEVLKVIEKNREKLARFPKLLFHSKVEPRHLLDRRRLRQGS